MTIDIKKATGRAKCRKCFKKIHEGELCFQYLNKFRFWWYPSYIHMDCVLDRKIIRKYHAQVRAKEEFENGRETNTH